MSPSLLRRLIPPSLKRMVRDYRSTPPPRSLRESTRFLDIGEPGPLIRDVFRTIKSIPGWFNVDDCGHFYLLLSYQSAVGLVGDLLEIGSYHGRSTALMARCLRPGESIFVCDAFQSTTEDPYSDKPSRDNLVANIRRVNPDLELERIVIHACLSNDLRLHPEQRFRFIHIDGGHSVQQTYSDLELCSRHVLSRGVIVVDDYHHRDYPGVAEGTDAFLQRYDAFDVLADLNRHGALGRKLYLVHRN